MCNSRSGRSPGGGHGNALQYSCLDNTMDRRDWQAIVHRVTQSQTWLNTRVKKPTTQFKKWAKDLNRHLMKEDIQMANKHMEKNAPHHMSSGKCKLKQQWDITIYLLEWPKSGTLTLSNAGEVIEQQELSLLLMGMQNGITILEDCLVVSHRTKHTLTIPSNSYIYCYLPKCSLDSYPHINLLRDDYSSLFIIAESWKQQRCLSAGEWKNKLWYKQTMEYYSVLKRNELSSCEKIWWNLSPVLLSHFSCIRLN